MVSITKQDVDEVLDEIDRQGIRRKNRSTVYCLVARGRHYPPKHMLRLIYEKKGEKFILHGGKPTNDELRAVAPEYPIIEDGCRNQDLSFVD